MQIYKIEIIKTKNGNTLCSHKNYLSSRVRNGWFFKSYNQYPLPHCNNSIFNISGQNTDKSQQLFENFSTSYILLQRAIMVGDYVEHVLRPLFRYTPSSSWYPSLSYIRTLLPKPEHHLLRSLHAKNRLDYSPHSPQVTGSQP